MRASSVAACVAITAGCRSEGEIRPASCPFVINEVMQDSRCDDRFPGAVDTGGVDLTVDERCDNTDSPDWIEIVNVTGSVQDLCSFQLRLDVAGEFPWVACDPEQPFIDCVGDTTSAPSNMDVLGNGRIVLIADNHASWGRRHVSFDIPSGRSTLELWSPEDQGERLCDIVTIEPLHQNESFARFPDITGEFRRDCSPTRGDVNENLEGCE